MMHLHKSKEIKEGTRRGDSETVGIKIKGIFPLADSKGKSKIKNRKTYFRGNI